MRSLTTYLSTKTFKVTLRLILNRMRPHFFWNKLRRKHSKVKTTSSFRNTLNKREIFFNQKIRKKNIKSRWMPRFHLSWSLIKWLQQSSIWVIEMTGIKSNTCLLAKKVKSVLTRAQITKRRESIKINHLADLEVSNQSESFPKELKVSAELQATWPRTLQLRDNSSWIARLLQKF